MRILFRKISDERHSLAIDRGNERRETVECETRSYLLHDLLHYAVEIEAGLHGGFWGNLATGKTLEQMNDRTGKSMELESVEMGLIEGVVGPMSGAVKGRTAADMVAGFERYAESMQTRKPDWLTESFVVAVQKRMRELQGAWKATPFGGVMELTWPSPPKTSPGARR